MVCAILARSARRVARCLAVRRLYRRRSHLRVRLAPHLVCRPVCLLHLRAGVLLASPAVFHLAPHLVNPRHFPQVRRVRVLAMCRAQLPARFLPLTRVGSRHRILLGAQLSSRQVSPAAGRVVNLLQGRVVSQAASRASSRLHVLAADRLVSLAVFLVVFLLLILAESHPANLQFDPLVYLLVTLRVGLVINHQDSHRAFLLVNRAHGPAWYQVVDRLHCRQRHHLRLLVGFLAGRHLAAHLVSHRERRQVSHLRHRQGGRRLRPRLWARTWFLLSLSA